MTPRRRSRPVENGTPAHGDDTGDPAARNAVQPWQTPQGRIDQADPAAFGPADGGDDTGLSGSVSMSAMSAGSGQTPQRGALVLLCGVGLALCVALVWRLATTPHLDATWRPTPQGGIELVSSGDAALAPHRGQVLQGASADGLPPVALDARALQRSARWVIDDADRSRQQSQQADLASLLQQRVVALDFGDGGVARVRPSERGVAGLSLIFWLLGAFGFGLFLVGGMTLFGGRDARSVAYAVMAACQAVDLIWFAVEAAPELGVPPPFARLDMPVRMALELALGVAMVGSACHYPRRLPGASAMTLAAGVAAALEVALYGAGRLPLAWWWMQGSVAAFSLSSIALLSWSYRLEMNPYALVLRRFGVLVSVTWVLLTAGLAASRVTPSVPINIADPGAMVWSVFLASLLMLVPFMARSHFALREFALLAAISTVASSLDLIFVSVCAFSPLAALTLSLLLAMVAYSLTRHWLTDRLRGESRLSTEYLFEQLYRAAREAEARPERTPLLFARLLGDLFQPLEIRVVNEPRPRTQVTRDGTTLLVPTPRLVTASVADGASAVSMRFARRGQRLFNAEDARLTDRIAEQLRRAVHFEQAVEHGRHEERLRLAQDLHDDIGARLLTMIYQAQTPEMGDYVRHTLQDLKTLTRGLAASSHRLSHSAAEWKADLTHRLTAAQVEVRWSFVFDEDVLLSVGQWSALTRVLRELVSNVIAHAHAHHLTVDFRLQADRVTLQVTDDGTGTNPAGWSPGLGLGGVRKRVRQLGGTVGWDAAEPQGIRCQVEIDSFSQTQR